MMKSICQSCNGRNACATARSSARIIHGFIWGKLFILSALRSSSLSALSGPFHDGILLKRSRFYIPIASHMLLTISRHYQQSVDQSWHQSRLVFRVVNHSLHDLWQTSLCGLCSHLQLLFQLPTMPYLLPLKFPAGLSYRCSFRHPPRSVVSDLILHLLHQ